MFVKLINFIILLFFAIVPFFFLLYYRKIDETLKQYTQNIKTVDLLVPYLLLSVWKLSSLSLHFPFHNYYMLCLIIYGIGLACYYTFHRKELIIPKFLRIWWRTIFLVSLPTHLILSIIAIYRYLF